MIHQFQLAKAFPLGPLTATLSQSWVLRVPETHLALSLSSFLQGMQKRVLQYFLRQWRLRVWGLDPPSSSLETILAPEPWDYSLGGEAWPSCRTSEGSLEKVRGWSGLEMGGPRTHPLSPDFQGPHPPGGFLVGVLWAAGGQKRDCAFFPGRCGSSRLRAQQ